MPLPEGLTPTSRHRVLLKRGHDAKWWVYESENPPGYVDDAGVAYSGVTYTLKFGVDQDDEDTGDSDESTGDEDTEDSGYRIVLLAAEVDGFVLATAWQYGDEYVAEIAYRPGIGAYPHT